MRIGIDFGATTTDIVALYGRKIKGISFSAKKKYSVGELVRKLGVDGDIYVTGGNSGKKKYKHINEIKAIGVGGAFLAKKKKCLVASLGTGTCIVNVNGNKINHVGGSGVGGGTVLGLSKLLGGINNIKSIERLTSKGNLQSMDITVKDIIGSGIGKVPGHSTASNFGKALSKRKEDRVLAACTMVGQVAAMLCIFASDSSGQKNIVLTGKLTEIKPVVIAMKKVAKIYNKNFIIPKYAGIGTAIGAALDGKIT